MLQHPSEPGMCRQCGGLCCQGHAGSWVEPQRFVRLFFPAGEIDVGKLPQGVLLRSLGGIDVPAPRTVEHGCMFLGEDGCQLPLAQRPCQCLALQPQIETLSAGEIHCTLPPEYGSNTARQNWKRFWEIHKENGETP